MTFDWTIFDSLRDIDPSSNSKTSPELNDWDISSNNDWISDDVELFSSTTIPQLTNTFGDGPIPGEAIILFKSCDP